MEEKLNERYRNRGESNVSNTCIYNNEMLLWIRKTI